jgi:hypothetical protein
MKTSVTVPLMVSGGEGRQAVRPGPASSLQPGSTSTYHVPRTTAPDEGGFSP